MAEASRRDTIDRARWRRALRHLLRAEMPELRVVAEGFLAETSEIDLLAVGPRSEWVSVRIAADGQDREGLTTALGDLAWLRARSRDLLKLAPELGVDPEAPPRALLYSEALAPETRSALELLPEGWIGARRVIPLVHQGRLSLVPDPTETSPATHARSSTSRAAPGEAPASGRLAEGRSGPRALPGHGGRRLTDPPSPSRFRTGLTDADLEPLLGQVVAPANGG